jgi:hypothetical protein
MNHTLTSDPGTAATDPRSRPNRIALGAIAVAALVFALSLAIPEHRTITDSAAQPETQTRTQVVDRGRPALAGSPVRRPVSADAAERWWLECTADLPTTPDAAERRLARCW